MYIYTTYICKTCQTFSLTRKQARLCQTCRVQRRRGQVSCSPTQWVHAVGLSNFLNQNSYRIEATSFSSWQHLSLEKFLNPNFIHVVHKKKKRQIVSFFLGTKRLIQITLSFRPHICWASLHHCVPVVIFLKHKRVVSVADPTIQLTQPSKSKNTWHYRRYRYFKLEASI